jgi:hypothetical protein
VPPHGQLTATPRCEGHTSAYLSALKLLEKEADAESHQPEKVRQFPEDG